MEALLVGAELGAVVQGLLAVAVAVALAGAGEVGIGEEEGPGGGCSWTKKCSCTERASLSARKVMRVRSSKPSAEGD
jgi:hypothetical protein